MKILICRCANRGRGHAKDASRWPEDRLPVNQHHCDTLTIPKLKPVFTLLLALVLLFASIVQGECQDGNKPLLLGIRVDAPPFSSLADINGDPAQASGYTVDLCKRIAKRAVDAKLFSGIEFKKVTAADRFDALKRGEIDMLCGASTVTLERLRVADFSLFTFLSGASVMYRRNSASENDEKNTNPMVGVLGKTTTENEANQILQDLQKKNSQFGFPAQQKLKLRSFEYHYDGLKALQEEEIMAYVADREILLALRQKALHENEAHKTDIVVAEDYYTTEHYAIGLRIGSSELRYIANSVLSELFTWDHAGYRNDNIFTVLRDNFPKKRFSKTLETLFRLQRISKGKPIPAPEPKPQRPAAYEL